MAEAKGMSMVGNSWLVPLGALRSCSPPSPIYRFIISTRNHYCLRACKTRSSYLLGSTNPNTTTPKRTRRRPAASLAQGPCLALNPKIALDTNYWVQNQYNDHNGFSSFASHSLSALDGVLKRSALFFRLFPVSAFLADFFASVSGSFWFLDVVVEGERTSGVPSTGVLFNRVYVATGNRKHLFSCSCGTEVDVEVRSSRREQVD